MRSGTLTKQIAAFGTWPSPISPDTLFDRSAAPAQPVRRGRHWYWIESRPQERGRMVLVCKDGGGRRIVTADGFNIRTRVHEYGGKCFAIGEDSLYFSNYGDDGLYCQSLFQSDPPRRLLNGRGEGGRRMFADLQLTPDGRFLICVCEQERAGAENENLIIAVATVPEGAGAMPCVLARGRDFYANPVISADGARLAWIQWDHPYMPWDESEVMLADLEFDAHVTARNPRHIAGGAGVSVCQLAFTVAGELIFVADRDRGGEPADNCWNIHVHGDGQTRRLTDDVDGEYGAPHWVFGDARHAFFDAENLLAVRTGQSGDELVRINLENDIPVPIASPYSGFSELQSGPDATVAAVCHAVDRPPAIVEFADRGEHQRVVEQHPPLLDAGDISIAEPLCYATRDGGRAYGYFYRPHNVAYQAPAGDKPPLLVMVHGGPTSRAVRTLDLTRQFWTSAGFALFDVNHRGSTGCGRRYRQSLLGHWGERDTTDVVDGIEYLCERGLVDSDRVFVRGRSAGGYAVLCLLTGFAGHFAGGACYFGIGNLVTLCETTHKFESRYTERLVGEKFDPEQARLPTSAYYRRSPVNHFDRLQSPMIIFQGAKDAVVPPRVAREMVAVLREAGIEHEYREYPGEGHGFRSKEANTDALTREMAFYRKVMGLVG